MHFKVSTIIWKIYLIKYCFNVTVNGNISKILFVNMGPAKTYIGKLRLISSKLVRRKSTEKLLDPGEKLLVLNQWIFQLDFA